MLGLDQLLKATGTVPDISSASLAKGKTELDAALLSAELASATAPGPERASWHGSRRAKTLIGAGALVAGAAAAAIAVAVSTTAPGAPAKPSAYAPSARSTDSSSATLTAAFVLDQAARAAGAQSSWPNARYWYTEDKYECGGQLYTDKTWLSRYGTGVVEKSGPKNGGSCSADLFTTAIPAGTANTTFGPYTWSELFALPTDPAKLEPELMADSQNTIYEHPVTAAQWQQQQDSFEFVMMTLLCDTPAPPALREALFKVAAAIPGVKVTGSYKDALGRTGTALQLGTIAIVIDPSSGVVLDETNDGSTIMFVAQGPADTEPELCPTNRAGFFQVCAGRQNASTRS
jgi:hypothetical protein